MQLWPYFTPRSPREVAAYLHVARSEHFFSPTKFFRADWKSPGTHERLATLSVWCCQLWVCWDGRTHIRVWAAQKSRIVERCSGKGYMIIPKVTSNKSSDSYCVYNLYNCTILWTTILFRCPCVTSIKYLKPERRNVSLQFQMKSLNIWK